MGCGSERPVFKSCLYQLLGEWRGLRGLGEDRRTLGMESTGLTKKLLSVHVCCFPFFPLEWLLITPSFTVLSSFSQTLIVET